MAQTLMIVEIKQQTQQDKHRTLGSCLEPRQAKRRTIQVAHRGHQELKGQCIHRREQNVEKTRKSRGKVAHRSGWQRPAFQLQKFSI